MNQITQTVLYLWNTGRKTKTSPSGWLAGNAPCCVYQGHTPDKRSRGGIILKPDGGFNWHCFNCGFKAGWSPGKILSANTKSLLKWLGLPDSDVNRLALESLKLKDQYPNTSSRIIDLELKELQLPENCLTINEWLEHGCQDVELMNCVDYIVNQRKMEWDWFPWHWCPDPGYQDRVIIPFYQEGKVVGYTGRKITEGKPKYLTVSQPGYVFNVDRQKFGRKHVIVVEGQFDAIAVDGVALMTNEPSDHQTLRINLLNREVICVPDRDRAGAKLLNHAIKNNWSVSLPPWGENIKDVADAVKSYGRLYVLNAILHYKVHGPIKIQLLKNQLDSL